MSKLEKYFSQFEEKELEDNFSELVRKYNEKEKREPRNVESAFFYPIKVGSSVLFEASFQDYKNDIERRKSEGIEIQAIRDFYQKKVIDKFLSDKRLSEIYEKIKVGEPIKNPPFSNIIKKWSFWSNVHRVQDIIKLEKFLKELSLQQPENNKPNETKKENDKPDKIKKELHHFLNQIDNERKLDFLNELKELFPTEIGLSIRAIIEILKENNMLIIGTREFKAFLKELKDFFDRNIGSYQSINDETPDDIIKETILLKLKPLIDKYKQS